MNFIDILMIIVLTASVVFNLLMYSRNKKLAEKCAKEKARLNKYRADIKRQEANRILVHQQSGELERDYADDEECYKGIGGGDR
mgnify:CR=1 FL=1